MVGARAPSAAGERFARTLARELAEARVTVVSGLALGIDAAAHAGALDGGGGTIAVLGCGIDRDYPRRNAGLAARIAATGAVVSEWGPGVEPAPWRFPVRNRIVAALAQVTVVVEATRRSGALITADHALALGRDVLAVPGAPWLDLAGGTLALLRAGAAPVGGASDVLDALGVQMAVEPGRVDPPAGVAGVLWTQLRRRPRRRDTLALVSGLAADVTSAALAELELDGLVVEERDGTLSALEPVRQRPVKTRRAEGRNSAGRASVSKTEGRRFEPCRPCSRTTRRNPCKQPPSESSIRAGRKPHRASCGVTPLSRGLSRGAYECWLDGAKVGGRRSTHYVGGRSSMP